MKRIRNMFSSVSVKILMIMIALVFPLNVIAIVYTDKAVSAMEEQAEFNIQKVVDYKMQELGNRMNVSQSLLSYFVTKDVDFLTMQKDSISDYTFASSKMKAYVKIKNMDTMTEGADGYFYYHQTRKDGVIYANPDKIKELAGHLEQMLLEYSRENNPLGWHIYNWNQKRYLVLLMEDGKMIYGSAIRLEEFLESVKEGMEYPVKEISITEEPPETGSLQPLEIHSSIKRLNLCIISDKKAVWNQMPFSQQLMWKIAVLYLILIPILYVILRKLLIKPLHRVNEAHRQLEMGNGDYRIQNKISTREYRELYTSFNRMADRLKRYKIENYEKEISKQKMELRNLQLQIRPHFLLNTFNIIFSLAQKKEYEMIQETVIYLSDYFRYIFRSGKEMELFNKELSLIKGYVRTASIRYSGNVEAEYEFDPELDFVRTPPLLIHNFVENAVKYGMKKEEVLHIWLEGKYDDGIVTITVEDDGKGMDADMLERNRKMFRGEYKPENTSEHLGLYNSLKRLKYFYGEKAFIEVSSVLGEGTCFRIIFPYNVEVDDEFIDC